jgi:hypothetical protein
MRKPPRSTTPVDQNEVTASEIACFAYCAKAWHLEHVLHLAPEDDVMERRELGVDAHQLHGRQVRLVESIAQRKGRLIASLLLLAIVAAIAALLL